MKNYSRLFVFICGSLVLLLAGCSTIPFEPPPKADYRNLEPQEVVDEFGASVARNFELLESVVFRFFGQELTGMGYLLIDADSESYALSCMTPAGIKLFEFTGEGEKVDALFVPPQLEKMKKEFADSVALDIRRIYLGWTPSPEARLDHRKDRLVYEVEGDAEKVTYTYAGPQRTLVEKRFSKGWRTRAIVRYFNYKSIGGELYPHGIVLNNKQHHYRLILRVKSVVRDGQDVVAGSETDEE